MTAMRSFLTLLTFTGLLAALAGSAPAAPGDENWDDAFGLPGVTGYVEATATFEGDLIIGGDFLGVGGVGAVNVARRDGTDWVPMGDGLEGGVYALVVWNGELYAGGAFNGGLARWDGAQWVDVDGGVDGYVEALLVWNGDLVIAGGFSSAGSGATTVGNVAIFDGVSWSDVDGGSDGVIYDLEAFGTSLYACGQFGLVGGASAANLARWSGSSWFAVGSGLKDEEGDPYNAYGSALAVHGGRLIVGGYFAQAGSLAVNHLTGWNGTTFSTVGTFPFLGEITSLGRWGADLVAADSYGSVERWNGTFWNFLGGAFGNIYALGEHAGALIAAGAYGQIATVQAAGIASYNGAWSALGSGSGANGIVECIGAWNGMTIVGGSFGRIGGVSSSIAAWDGSAFQPLGSGIPPSFGTGVNAVVEFQGDLVVGGSFSSAGGVPANKVARWDGAQWSAMGAGSLGGVRGLAVLDGELYAIGYWGTQQTLGRWNGSDFQPLGTGVSGGVQILYGLGSFQGGPVMGGGFTSVNGVPAANIARWNGTAWQALGSGTSGAVFAILESGGILYVAGVFSQAGGAPAANVAAWNGSSWSALGAGVNGRVFGLAAIGTDIYATGEFTQAGGQPARYVARWDGAAWHALGSGLDAEGRALAAPGDGRLWVGGEFKMAGTVPSSRLGRWQPAAASAVEGAHGTARIAMRPAWPNPFTATTAFAFDLSAPADVVIDVFDVRGARIRSFAENGLAAGSHRVAWDGRDERGRPAPAGVYFAALRGTGAATRQRVVLVR